MHSWIRAQYYISLPPPLRTVNYPSSSAIHPWLYSRQPGSGLTVLRIYDAIRIVVPRATRTSPAPSQQPDHQECTYIRTSDLPPQRTISSEGFSKIWGRRIYDREAEAVAKEVTVELGIHGWRQTQEADPPPLPVQVIQSLQAA